MTTSCNPPKQSKYLNEASDVDSSLREQIMAITGDDPRAPVMTNNIMSLVASYIEAADNVRLVANSIGSATWLDPQTGAKVYNQAHIKAAEIEGATKLAALLKEGAKSTGSVNIDEGLSVFLQALKAVLKGDA